MLIPRGVLAAYMIGVGGGGGAHRASFSKPKKESEIRQFRYIEIQPKTIDLSTRLFGITTEFVGFISQRVVLRPVV